MLHDDFAGLTAVKHVGIYHTLGKNHVLGLLCGGGGTTVSMIESHQKEVGSVLLSQYGAGVGFIDLSEEIVIGERMGFSVCHKDRAECQGEEDVIFLHIAFCIFFGCQFFRIGEAHLTFGIDVAEFEFMRIEAVEGSHVNHHAFRTEFIEIAVHCDNGVGILGEFRAVFLNRGTIVVPGEFPAELGRIRDIDFCKGAGVVIDFFTPGIAKNGFIAVIAETVTDKGAFRIKVAILALR